jgi:phosphatidylserine decarboxylase
LAKDAWSILIPETAVLLFLLAACRWLSWSWFLAPAVIVAALLVFTAYFFRDPDREVPTDENCIVSPADGEVVEVGEVRDPKAVPFLAAGARKVAIFLSVWDVHVNRIPAAGKVSFLKYQKGIFLKAYRSDAGTRNEQMLVGIESRHGKILMKQITGILARRIVCRLERGDSVKLGERFGMMKFGSRAELYVPLSVRICVQVGDKVKAGQSIIGETGHGK